MPELPEVEALREFLDEHLGGRVVERVLPLAVSVLKTYEPPLTALEGQTAGSTTRYGKFLALRIGELHLVTHLARVEAGCAGRTPCPPSRRAPARGRWRCASSWRAAGASTSPRPAPRSGSRCTWSATPRRSPASPGSDPTRSPTASTVTRSPPCWRGNGGRSRACSATRASSCGIGNAYSDEILHAAKVSPFKLAASFEEDQVTHLYEAVRETLRTAVERAHGVAAGRLKAEKKSGLRVHGRAGEPCPVCGDTIRSVSFADSSLEYCPTCQTGGKPLADRRLSRLLK